MYSSKQIQINVDDLHSSQYFSKVFLFISDNRNSIFIDLKDEYIMTRHLLTKHCLISKCDHSSNKPSFIFLWDDFFLKRVDQKTVFWHVKVFALHVSTKRKKGIKKCKIVYFTFIIVLGWEQIHSLTFYIFQIFCLIFWKDVGTHLKYVFK